MIRMNNISKRFGKKIIFKDFSLNVDDNGIFALKGPSGCGKTTLLRMIAGLDKKFSGKIEYGNVKKISYVFQEPRLLPDSDALENVMLVLGNDENAEQKAKDMLSKMGLENDFHTYPEEMSGGMKMRVAIARALVYNGDLLLLDEAFNGIDAERTKSIMDMIVEYSKQSPVIFVTHNDEQIEYMGCKIIEI